MPSDTYIPTEQIPAVQVQNEHRQRRSTESEGRSIGSNKIVKGSTHTSKSREGLMNLYLIVKYVIVYFILFMNHWV